MVKKSLKLKGFTLVELIVVIAIIGVLAAMLIPNMMNYIKKSQYTKANANAKSIYNMLASSAVDLDLSGNNLGSFKINKTDMEQWIDSLNLSKGQEGELNREMGGYIAMSYEGGYPKIVAWGDDNGSVIGRYPNPTNDTMYVTWDNVFSEWNNKSDD